jgi:outer membrane lipoprotein-sorting protein
LPPIFLFLGLLLLPARAADPTVVELLNATDDIQRGTSSAAVLQMEVKTARYERKVTLRVWSKGADKSLIVIEAPSKDKGIATLKDGDNIWNYLPKVDRTVKVPSGMMSGSWMGSHFSNDDLVKQNRLADEFTAVIEARPTGGVGSWVLRLTPKPDAPVVWGAVVVTVSAEIIPESIEYFDEDGALARSMRFDKVQDIAGHKVPMVMTLIPADKPDERTRVTYQSLEFDVELQDSLFTLQGLRQ